MLNLKTSHPDGPETVASLYADPEGHHLHDCHVRLPIRRTHRRQLLDYLRSKVRIRRLD